MRRILAALLVAIIFALLWATAFSAELEQVTAQRIRYDPQQRQMPYRGVAVGIDDGGRIYSTHEMGLPGATNISTTVHTGTFKQAGIIGQSIYRGESNRGAGNDRPKDLVALPGGGCVVTGEISSFDTRKLILNRYSAAGGVVWQYARPRYDFSAGYALTLIGQEKVAVAGSVSSEQLDDYYVAVFEVSSGKMLWERQFDGGRTGADYPRKVVADAEGNVYVTGYTVRQGASPGSAVEIVVAKLAADDGRVLWKTINTHDIGFDYPHGLAVDQQGNAIVTGQEWNGTDYTMITMKYLSSSGARQWVARSGGLAGRGTLPERGAAVAVTSDGDVVVTGTHCVSTGKVEPARAEFVAIKYSRADGTQQWMRSFTGPNLTYGAGYGVVIDREGAIWVTGVVSQEGQADFYTAKLDGRGIVVAASAFDALGSSEDGFTEEEQTFHDGHKLALSPDGGVVLIGSSSRGGNSESILLKYRHNPLVPKVTTAAPSNVSVKGTMLNATIEGQGVPGTAWIEWGNTAAYGTKGRIQQFSASKTMVFSEMLQSTPSIDRHTTYNFRAVASTDTGLVYGANRSFVTNVAPVAIADQYHLKPGELLECPVLVNDSDADRDNLEFVATSDGAHGKVTIGPAGVLRYTPREAFDGNDSFRYTIGDGFGGEATTTVSLVNSAPVAQPDVIESAFETAVDVAVTSNDADADGDPLEVRSFEPGKHGTVEYGEDGVLRYTPDPEFAGVDSFNYELSDGWVAVQGMVTIRVLPPAAPVIRAAASSSMPVPGSGGGRVPEGAQWLSFGQPATDREGHLVFSARFVSPQGVQAGVFGPIQSTELGAVALSGEAAPGFDDGTQFLSFGDPVVARFNPSEIQPINAVAFTGTVSGQGVTSRNDLGLWTTATADGNLRLVVREGAPMPIEEIAATRVQEIQSFVLTRSGLWIVARLAKGDGAVTPNNDVVLLYWDGSTLQLHLREGEQRIVAGRSKVIRNLAAFVPARGSGSAWCGYDETSGAVVSRVTFTDGTQALTDGTTLVATNDAVGEAVAEARWARFGMPAIASANNSNQMLIAFAGEMRIGRGGVRPMNDCGIFVANTAEGIAEGEFLVRQNDPVMGIPGVRFASFKDPVIGSPGNIAFIARLAGRGVSEKNREALFWDSKGSLRMLVREGAIAPGAPEANIDQISAVALSASDPSDEESAPVFEAKLRSGSMSIGDGLWAVDSIGTVQIVLRSGMNISVGSEMKTLNRFAMLRTLNGSPKKGRALDGYGHIVGLGTFNDGSQAILRITLP